MYQALSRKYRPRTFDDVVGQSHITRTLQNEVKTDRQTHLLQDFGKGGQLSAHAGRKPLWRMRNLPGNR